MKKNNNLEFDYEKIRKLFDKYFEMIDYFSDVNKNEYIYLTSIEFEQCVKEIISYLDILSKKEIFGNLDFTHFNNYIYEVCYQYMKLEFVYNDYSLIFNYVVTNDDICKFFNNRIQVEIDEMLNSVNYMCGLDYLKSSVDSLNNKDNFMNKKVIKALSICSLPFIFERILYMKLVHILRKFRNLEKKSSKLLSKKRHGYYKISKILKANYMNILSEYNNLCSNYGFLINKESNSVKMIDNYVLKFKKDLSK